MLSLFHNEISCRTLQIEEHLGLNLPFTAIFEHPTLRALAAHLLMLLHSPGAAPIGAQVRVCCGWSIVCCHACFQPPVHLVCFSTTRSSICCEHASTFGKYKLDLASVASMHLKHQLLR